MREIRREDAEGRGISEWSGPFFWRGRADLEG